MRDKIAIIVERRRQSIRQPRRRGPVDGKRRREYLARRRRTGGINFYDLGYKRAGEGGPFNTVNILTLSTFTPVGPAAWSITEPSPESIDAALRSQTAAVPGPQLKTLFFKVTKGDASTRLGLELSFGSGPVSPIDSLPEWTDGGLSLTPDQAAALRVIRFNPKFGRQVDLGATGGKVTTTPDFSSAAVTFTPSNQMNVFLMPQIVKSHGGSSYSIMEGDDPFTITDYIAYLNYIYLVFSRDVILNADNPFFGFPLEGNWTAPADPVEGQRAGLLHRSLPGSRSPWTLIVQEFPSEDIILFDRGTDTPMAIDGLPGQQTFSITLLEILPNPLLQAVIEKAGVFYYFWN